jgi:hypothetical protein
MDDTENIRLHEYDPMTMMRHDATVLVVGQRGSGKTVMMQYLLYCMAKRLDTWVVFCPTRDTRQEYEKCIPKCNVHAVYDKKLLGKICDAQKQLSPLVIGEKKEGEGEEEKKKEGEGLRRVGIILDDCMFDKAEIGGKAMRYLMMNGRHDNFFYLNGVQYIVDFPKDLRSQVDTVIVFPEANLEYREPLRKNLLGVFQTDEQLVRTFKEGLKAHEALVFDSRAYREKRPHLFFCKAQLELPAFRAGADWVWRLYYKYMTRKSNAAIVENIKATLAMAKSGGGGGGEGEKTDKDGKPKMMVERCPRGSSGAMGGAGGAGGATASAGKKKKRTTPLPTLAPMSLLSRV